MKKYLIILPLLLIFLIPSNVFASGSYNLDGACLTSSFNNTCNNNTTTYWDFAYNGTLNTINIIEVYPYQSFTINKGDRVFISFSLTEQYVSTGETNVWTINDPIPYGPTNDYFNLIDSRVTVLSDWYAEKDGYGTDNAGSYNSRLFTIILEAKQSGTYSALKFRLNGSLGYYYNNIGGLKFRGYVYYGDIDYQTELLYMLVNQNSNIVSSQQANTNAINNMNNNITSTSTNGNGIDSATGTIQNLIPTDSKTEVYYNNVFSFFNRIKDSVNTSCSAYSMQLMDQTITFPCVDMASIFGDWWGVIDMLCCIWPIINIFNLFIGWVDAITDLEDMSYFSQAKHVHWSREDYRKGMYY